METWHDSEKSSKDDFEEEKANMDLKASIEASESGSNFRIKLKLWRGNFSSHSFWIRIILNWNSLKDSEDLENIQEYEKDSYSQF